jgi:hypothetical protein
VHQRTPACQHGPMDRTSLIDYVRDHGDDRGAPVSVEIDLS